MENKNTLFPELPNSSSSAMNSGLSTGCELDFDAMFASCPPSSTAPVLADPSDGTVDIRGILGKCGRETENDRPVVIVTQTSIERGRKTEEDKKEQVDVDKDKQNKLSVVLDSGAIFRRFRFDGECEYVT